MNETFLTLSPSSYSTPKANSTLHFIISTITQTDTFCSTSSLSLTHTHIAINVYKTYRFSNRFCNSRYEYLIAKYKCRKYCITKYIMCRKISSNIALFDFNKRAQLLTQKISFRQRSSLRTIPKLHNATNL